jgi:hypothetical protein
MTTNAGYRPAVDQIVPYPDRDLAVARLSKPALGVRPVRISGSPGAVGDTVSALGYGRTADTWVPDHMHSGDFTITAVGSATVDVSAGSGSTLCKGDAGGPALHYIANPPHQVGLPPEHWVLNGVHAKSWQGGCLAETSTRHDAIETRVDDLASWISANTASVTPSLQLALTASRIGLIKGDLSALYKDGGLSTAWQSIAGAPIGGRGIRQIALAGTRMAILTNDGMLEYTDTQTMNVWGGTFIGAKQIALSSNRLVVLQGDGTAQVAEGGFASLSDWTTVGTKIQQLEVTDTRVGLLTNAGAVQVNQGALTAAWNNEYTGVKQIRLTANRIGIVTTAGAAKVKDGTLSAGWVDQATSGVASLVMDGDRVGVLTTDKVAKVKDGALTATFNSENSNVRQLSLGADRIGVVLTTAGPWSRTAAFPPTGSWSGPSAGDRLPIAPLHLCGR